jgi:alkylation response protein AidB-like acyl-CoA dehydrogenase
MDFSWTEEQLAYRKQVLEFAASELNDAVIDRDRSSEFFRDGWDRCAEFGIQKLAVDESYSGAPERDVLTGMLAMEAMGYGCRDNGLTFGLNAHMWTVQLPIQHYGSDIQKQKYLPRMSSGEWIGAHAMTEPDYGSDAFNLKTHARKVDGGYILNGHKTLITFAPIADVVLLFATTNPELGKWGVTAFLLEKSFDGYRTSPVKEKMGLRTVPFGDIELTDCFVPEENRLGTEGSGVAISTGSLEYERCCILASQLGAMEYQLERSIEYARNRIQSGQPIGKFQSVSNRIADMKMRLETARLMLYKVAWLKQQDKPAMMEAAILKLYLSEQFVDSSLDAIRIHGGVGYMTETGIERDLRDAIGGVIYAGTSDIQRNIIAGLLGL